MCLYLSSHQFDAVMIETTNLPDSESITQSRRKQNEIGGMLFKNKILKYLWGEM